jgi:mannose-6-phosphate isomerase-like protein (cupin superfamily)
VSKFGDSLENKVTGERAVILRGDEDANGLPGLGHLIVKPEGRLSVVGEHLHPHTQERFRVVSGSLGARIGGKDRTLVAGDDVTVAAGTPHDWWNDGDVDAGVLVETTPADGRFVDMLATVFGLANDGKTDAKGMPDLLQLAMIGREFGDVIQFTKPPGDGAESDVRPARNDRRDARLQGRLSRVPRASRRGHAGRRSYGAGRAGAFVRELLGAWTTKGLKLNALKTYEASPEGFDTYGRRFTDEVADLCGVIGARRDGEVRADVDVEDRTAPRRFRDDRGRRLQRR